MADVLAADLASGPACCRCACFATCTGPEGVRGCAVSQERQRGLVLLVVIALERFQTFLDDERYDRERRDGVGPPPAEGGIQY